jgi:hypothetical protein
LGRRSWLRTSPSLRPPLHHTFFHMRKELELVFKTLRSVQKARQWPRSENQETLTCNTPPSEHICLFATLQLKQFKINQFDKIISVRFFLSKHSSQVLIYSSDINCSTSCGVVLLFTVVPFRFYVSSDCHLLLSIWSL